MVLTFLMMTTSSAFALTGYDIVKKSDDEQQGFKGQTSDAIMVLYDAKGKKTVAYKLKQFWLEGSKENDNTTKSMIRFLAPADSKGTALLTHEQEGKDERRWLYLAETRKVKQIGSGSRSASFKGSEFAYEDMSSDVLDKYDYKLIGEQKFKNRPCHLIERKPKFGDSGYSKVVTCFDKENDYVLESKFYDKAGKLMKVLHVGGYKKVSGKWRAHMVNMQNVQTKKRTAIKTGKYKFPIKLSDRMFTVSQLQKN